MGDERADGESRQQETDGAADPWRAGDEASHQPEGARTQPAGADDAADIVDATHAVGAVEPARAHDTIFGSAAKPRELGRYVVLDTLGRGGMGVVLRAYDRELDRTVALKVLHRELDAKHTQRLRREAQAMAKLSHPNVVQVFEVGEVEGQTFVAMELVKGTTVRAWMDQEPRPGWRACVELFLQLGAALAAAHEQGLVHRDFKPGNAIVDEKGRARVLDFGLARLVDETDEIDEDPSGMLQQVRTDAHAVVPLELSLTRTGAVLGTPAYMPPEQMDGRPAGARSDQFSFCVALYEAVYGERPYQGGSMTALMLSMRVGVVRPAPKVSDVPVALRKVLLRGLARDLAERWPSMEALLEELRRAVAPRRRRAMVVVGAGVLAAGAGLGTTQTLEWLHRCTGARTQLAGAWDDGRRREVKTAILGTQLSYAPGTWERVEPRLDAYSDAWASEHTDACEATKSRGEQSEEEMSLRMGCLHERWQYLRATVDELADADATVVENAVKAVASLPGLERCRDLEALRAEVPPPEDPAVAERVAALDEWLVEASAKEKAGKYEDGLRLADDVVQEAAGLDYEPLMARAWLRQGSLRQQRGDYEGAVEGLKKAFAAALAHTMKVEAASASVQLVFVLGNSLARHEEARGWAEHAEPLSRAAGTDEARASYLNNLGSVAYSQGKYEQARELFERGLALREKTSGAGHPDVAASLNNLGNVVYSQGKVEQARELFERGLALYEKALGTDHPNVAYSLNNLGNVAYSLGQHEQARELYERGLAIREKALGADHPNVAVSLNNLGAVAYSQGKYEQARDSYERARTIFQKALGADHPQVGYALNNLGNVAKDLGEYEQAQESYERALASLQEALGADHPDVALLLNNLGEVAKSRGKYEQACDFFGRALAHHEKGLGADHPDVASSLTGLGETLIALARPAEALAPLERALTVRTTHEGDPASLADTRFTLARALWTVSAAQGRDRARAHTLAEQSRDAYGALGDAAEPRLATVQAWLAEHPLP